MFDILLPKEVEQTFTSGELSSLLNKQPELTLSSSSVYDNGRSEKTFQELCGSLKENESAFKDLCELNKHDLFPLYSYTKALGAKGGIGLEYKNRFLMPIVFPKTIDEEKANETFPLAVIRSDKDTSGIEILFKGKKVNYVSALYLYYGGKKEIETIDDYAMWPTTGTTSLEYSPALNFIKTFNAEFEDAAKILQAAHPDLHLDNLRLWIKGHFIHELRNLDEIDYWQDISSCREVNCPLGTALEKAFPSLSRTNELSLAWKMITALKNNKMNQGFGAGQIILGQAMEAASDGRIMARYEHVLTPDVATSPDAMLLAILDPKKAIYVKTMIYDHLLTRLKETVFKDQNVRFASDIYPYISDPEGSREAALIGVAQTLAIYPERYSKVKSWLKNGMNLQHFNDLCGYADMLKIEPYFPSIACEKISTSRLTYTTEGELGLQVAKNTLIPEEKRPWTVYFIRPGWSLSNIADYFKAKLEPIISALQISK